jgi:hypothetical protein
MILTILTEDFRGFPKFLQANAGTVPRFGHGHSVPHPFQLCIHWSLYHSVLSSLRYCQHHKIKHISQKHYHLNLQSQFVCWYYWSSLYLSHVYQNVHTGYISHSSSCPIYQTVHLMPLCPWRRWYVHMIGIPPELVLLWVHRQDTTHCTRKQFTL